MKRWIALILLFAVLLTGCNGVYMNAKYAQLLDRTAALSDYTADVAEADQLTTDQMKTALRAQADVWAEFKAAKDGRETK